MYRTNVFELQTVLCFQMPITPWNMHTIYSKPCFNKKLFSLQQFHSHETLDQFDAEKYCEVRKYSKTSDENVKI